MAGIVKCKVRNQTYLYESVSYRDENGNVRNRRRIIGKLDPVTGEHIYKTEYVEEMGLSTMSSATQEVKLYTANDIKQTTVKEYGVFHLLDSISQQIGLTEALRKALPKTWQNVLNLAFYMLASGEPALYCEDWLYKSECYPCGDMSSQRISELLAGITPGERMSFYESWCEHRLENEYMALDITSISTYSELINDAEWGYNRDKERLPQVNICLLVGEKSGLPILQTVYSGSLTDVSTLKTTLQISESINLKNISVVMDKGFAKVKNINDMLGDESNIRFIIALPFTMTFAKKQVATERNSIDSVENTILIGTDILRGVTKEQKWNPKYKVFTHVYLDPETANNAKNGLYGKVKKLSDNVKRDPETHLNSSEVKKYLNVLKSTDNSYAVNIRHNVLSSELANKGWLVLISNHVHTAEEGIQIYRGKDVVEKGFQRMKNCLSLSRLRVHSDDVMQNKIFVGFLALILTAHIDNIMTVKGLYDSLTMKKLIKVLERLKIYYIKNNRIISPLTKEQRLIFEAFQVKHD